MLGIRLLAVFGILLASLGTARAETAKPPSPRMPENHLKIPVIPQTDQHFWLGCDWFQRDTPTAPSSGNFWRQS